MVDTNMQIVVRHPIEPDITRLTVVKGLMDESSTVAVKTVKRTVSKEKKKKTNLKSFKSWCMPVEQTGYIKCRKHDFL